MMPSPTTVRGILGHFVSGVDPLIVFQTISPLPVRALTYLSLRAILAAWDEGKRARVRAGRCSSPREGGKGGKGVGVILGAEGGIQTLENQYKITGGIREQERMQG